jgi:cellulose synthase (UDP-forming)
LTFLGLLINSMPEWRIVDTAHVIPVVAFWSAINVVVLFLICMMSLQAPMRRGEERFELNEPIWIVSRNGTISTGYTKDLSLSGVGLEGDLKRAFDARAGDQVRVFIAEVGFIAGTVARQVGQFVGIRFTLPPSVERDLLIRKMFTAGHDTTSVSASTWSVTGAMFKTIWQSRTEMLKRSVNMTPDVAPAPPIEKLAARSLVISPQSEKLRLSELVKERRSIAA